MSKTGTVLLVGAGPGDPGLMTLKAVSALSQADVILYDYLIPSNCLLHCKPEAILECVGKKKGEHSSTQSQINEKMLSYARQGKTVVRLKGGDPLIFGRGGEEMEYLREHGISYQVIPGVSSATSVPGMCGIPLTHRDFSRSVAFVTGTLQDGQSNKTLPHADTLVFLMAVTGLDSLTQRLSHHAPFTKDTPAALLYRGTLSQQKRLIGTLETISDLQKEHKMMAPSILVVGNVVSVAKHLEWTLPLSGQRVVLLRPYDQSQDLMEKLEWLGAEVLLSPMMALIPNPTEMQKITPLFFKGFTDVIFTSINGVRYFFEALRTNGCDLRTLAPLTLTTIGPRTEEELQKRGLFANHRPKTYHSKALADLFSKRNTSLQILIPTTEKADATLAEDLRAQGHTVTVSPLYTTEIPQKIWGDCRDGDHVFFTSASTAEHAHLTGFWTSQTIHAYSIGPKTSEAIHAFKPNYPLHTAPNATTDDMLTLLLETVQKGQDHDRLI